MDTSENMTKQKTICPAKKKTVSFVPTQQKIVGNAEYPALSTKSPVKNVSKMAKRQTTMAKQASMDIQEVSNT